MDPEAGTVEGTVRIESDAAEVREAAAGAPIWLYPRRFETPPAAIDERTGPWIHPAGFDPGTIEVLACELPGNAACTVVDGEGPSARVEFPDGVDPPAEWTLRFRTVVPERFGLFGRSGATWVLAGAWHPLPAAPPETASPLRGPIDAADYELRLRIPAGWSAVIDGEGPRVCDEDAGPDGCLVAHRSFGAEPPSVVLSEEPMFVRTTTAAGIEIHLVTDEPAPVPERFVSRAGRTLDPASVPDLWTIDRRGWGLDALARELRAIDAAGGLPPAARRSARITVVQVPLRMELVSGASGVVLLSDRAWKVFPLEVIFRFHDRELLLGVLAELFRRATDEGSPAERRWSSEMLAAAAAELSETEAERADDYLKYGAFLPIIDQMMFAPQMQFRDVYFDAVEETDGLRDEWWRFATDLPRGRRLWARLRDRLGPTAAHDLARRAAATGRTVHGAAAECDPPIDDFWRTWLGPYPSANLVLDGFETGTGDGGSLEAIVRLRLEGDPAAREFVTVRIRPEEGDPVDAVWDSASGPELRVPVSSPAASVELDPEGRIPQVVGAAGGHPRADDVSSLPWRLPTLDRIRLSLDLAEFANSEFDLDFTMRRRYDLVQMFRGRINRDARGYGGTFFYTHGFGPPRDLNRPTWAVTAFVQAFHYGEAFGGDEGAATSLDVGAYVQHDDRWFDLNPAGGWQAMLGVSGSFPVDGGDAWTARVAGRGFYLWTPHAAHTLAFYGGFGLLFGAPLDAQLEPLGDRYLLRAFAPDEALGRAKVYAGFEYRHLYTTDIDWNLAHVGRLRGIQGVLFAGAGTHSRRDALDGMFGPATTVFEAGYGLRLFIDWAGIQTGIVAIDLSVPFEVGEGGLAIPGWIRPDPSDASTFRRRPSLFGLPVGLDLVFNQTF